MTVVVTRHCILGYSVFCFESITNIFLRYCNESTLKHAGYKLWLWVHMAEVQMARFI